LVKLICEVIVMKEELNSSKKIKSNLPFHESYLYEINLRIQKANWLKLDHRNKGPKIKESFN